MRVFTVIVGNTGTVHKGHSYMTAKKVWHDYVDISKSRLGRSGGESVVLLIDDEIEDEFDGIREII